MNKQCGNCAYYEAIAGEPPAGYCRFMGRASIPFWMSRLRTRAESVGSDVLATDGENCDAYKQE